MAAVLLPNGKQQYFTATGIPLVGGKVYTYDTGTTNPRATWQDTGQIALNANPVILDARGEATIFWSGSYRVVITDSLGNAIWTVDGVASGTDLLSTNLANTASGSLGAALVGYSPALSYTAGSVGAFLNNFYPRTASEIAAGVTPTNYQIQPYHTRRYGVTYDGSTDNSVALANWLKSIPNLGEGVIDSGALAANYSTALVRTTECSIRGEGRSSHIHYTGAGVALTLQNGRAQSHDKYLLTGTATATGGLYVQKAQEGFSAYNMWSEGFTNASAYAIRFSDSWDVTLLGGGFRQSRKGMWFDDTDLGDGGINNTVIAIGVDCSSCETGVDFQSGQGATFLDIDTTEGVAVIAQVAGFEIARGLAGTKFCDGVTIGGRSWCEGTADGIRVGRSNTSSSTPTNITIADCVLINTGTNHIRLYKANTAVIQQSLWGPAQILIDAGVTNTTIFARGITITDNSTSGQTTYYQYGTATVNEINARQNLILSGAIAPTALTVNTNDYNPTGWSTANVLKISSTGAVDLTGLVPHGNYAVYPLINVGTSTITLKHESASSAAANRFTLSGAVDLALGRNGMAWLIYDQTSSRWYASKI